MYLSANMNKWWGKSTMFKNNNSKYTELRKRLETIADTIGADHEEIPFMANNKAWGRTFIEIDKNTYKIIEYDYAHYIQTITFDNVDDLVFEITQSLIFSVVIPKMKGFESGLVHNDRRYRARLFELEIEYASKISSEFKTKMEESISIVLAKHPYRD